MATTFTPQANFQAFPPGSSVAAYKRSNWAETQLLNGYPSGVPLGAADATVTAGADGAIPQFAGLTTETSYFLYSNASGSDRYVSFSTGDPNSASVPDRSITPVDVSTAYVDGAASAPSLRTLGTGAQQAAKGADTEYAFSRYRVLRNDGYGTLAASISSGTWVFYYGGGIPNGGANSGVGAFLLDPADFPGGAGRTLKIRIKAWVQSNAVAATPNAFRVALALGNDGGASGVVPTWTYSSTICSADIIPVASQHVQAVSADVNFPAVAAAGQSYAVILTTSATTAVGSSSVVRYELQARHV